MRLNVASYFAKTKQTAFCMPLKDGFGTGPRVALFLCVKREDVIFQMSLCWGGCDTVSNPMEENKDRAVSRDLGIPDTDSAQILNLCCHLQSSHTYCTVYP